jgi:hypothetical protein
LSAERGCLRGEGGVEVVDVGLVVLCVVEGHYLGGDDGFEGLIVLVLSATIEKRRGVEMEGMLTL